MKTFSTQNVDKIMTVKNHNLETISNSHGTKKKYIT